ncbi:MAG TPA: sensor histidine kinase [Solirubrobacteraceae bacterium]|nr:sensor histidine kinase [Solirubrobacteraceae bacterium]
MISDSHRWLDLFVLTRVVAALVGIALVGVTAESTRDVALIGACLLYAVLSCLAFVRVEGLQRSPAAWIADAVVGFALIVASQTWRSPFYLLAVTALVLPATTLPFRRAIAWGGAFSLVYFMVGVLTTLEANTIESAVSLETVTTRLLTPLLVAVALAYAQRLLDRLSEERERSERLAVQTERQRIAWELHDSAKQRVHAAHLVLSMVRDRVGEREGPLLDQALDELSAATGDMATSVAELREPLDGRPLEQIVAHRAQELASATRARIDVHGTAPALPPLVAAHATRIAGEALTNAVRHAGARHIEVRLDGDPDTLRIIVRDDGKGLPGELRPGSSGLRSMRERAATIGGRLDVAGAEGGGTVVALEVPLAEALQEV